MLPTLVIRTLRAADKRCIAKFLWNFGVKGMLSVEKFKRRIKRGDYFPPFLYLSIINSCNLRCQGCWVDVEEKDAIDLDTLNRTITDAKRHGNAFFGILGGEPFMHPELLDLLAAHPDCYFQLFSNGQFITRGVHYVWYHSYRPVGPKMNAQLALSPDQLVRVRKFVVEARAKMPIAIIDAYYDHDGQALCPMATGISHHVSPRGDIEPCPIIQFAVENVRDSRGLFETMRQSAFLRDFRELSAQATCGCVVLERPDLVKELVRKHGARDTTVRGTAMQELEAMQPRFSQWLPGEEVPEKHWLYRLAKRFWFSDFGAYRNGRHDVMSKARELKSKLAPALVAANTAARGEVVVPEMDQQTN